MFDLAQSPSAERVVIRNNFMISLNPVVEQRPTTLVEVAEPAVIQFHLAKASACKTGFGLWHLDRLSDFAHTLGDGEAGLKDHGGVGDDVGGFLEVYASSDSCTLR
jgi:hypothetical protein